MLSNISFRIIIFRSLVLVSLVVLLMGCGVNNATSTPTVNNATNTPTVNNVTNTPTVNNVTSTPTVDNSSINLNSVPLLQENNTTINVSSSETHCPWGDPNYPSDNVILEKGGKGLYSTGDIQQIRDYYEKLKGSFELTPKSLPYSGLRIQPGGVTTNVPFNNMSKGCLEKLEVTNIGTSAIQLRGIAIQITSSPQINTASYDLIDDCPIKNEEDISCTYSVGGQIGPVDAAFDLGNVQEGSLLTSQISYLDASMTIQVGTVVINPKETRSVQIAFTSQNNFTYTEEPELIINTLVGPKRLLLSRSISNLVFANANQFSCYRLKSDAFIQIHPGSDDPMRCV